MLCILAATPFLLSYESSAQEILSKKMRRIAFYSIEVEEERLKSDVGRGRHWIGKRKEGRLRQSDT